MAPAELTKTQTKVLRHLEAGKTPTQVAKSLKISRNGVYAHMRKMREKGIDLPNGSRDGGQPGAQAPTTPSSNGSPAFLGEIEADLAAVVAKIDQRITDLDAEERAIVERIGELREKADALRDENEHLALRRKLLVEPRRVPTD